MAGPPGFYTEIGGKMPEPEKPAASDASAAPAAPAAPAWEPEANAPYHRVTKIPIKPGSIGEIVAIAQTPVRDPHCHWRVSGSGPPHPWPIHVANPMDDASVIYPSSRM